MTDPNEQPQLPQPFQQQPPLQQPPYQQPPPAPQAEYPHEQYPQKPPPQAQYPQAQYPAQQYQQLPLQQPYAPGYAQPVAATNGFATAALILGICGFIFMAIPFFVGWFLGGIPDILAVVFGIIGIGRASTVRVGMGAAVTGLVLASVSLLSVFIGAGSIW